MRNQNIATFSISVAMSIVLLALQSGCTSLHSVSFRTPGLKEGDRIIVELANGESRKLDLLSLNSEIVEGYDQNEYLHSIDMSSVDRIMIRRYDRHRTNKAILTTVVIVGAAGAVAVAAAAPYGIPIGFPVY